MISKIASRYLQLSNYQVDNKSLLLQLETHPEYPSLRSLSDTFDYFKIENIVARVPPATLEKLPELFLTVVVSDNKSQLVLAQKKGDRIVTVDANNQKTQMHKETFREIWEGTIMAVGTNTETGVKKVRNYSFPLYVLTGIVLLILAVTHNPSAALYYFLSFCGLFISILIVQQAAGIPNGSVTKVCQLVGKEGGCSRVIRSELIKIGSYSLSDLCILYFTGLFLSGAFIGFSYALALLLAVMSIPIVAYSLISQSLIIKEWCSLCLGIALVLSAQALFLLANPGRLQPDMGIAFQTVALFFLLSVFWIKAKPAWLEYRQLQTIRTDFLKFKRNRTLFETLLKKEKVNGMAIMQEEHTISFGPKNATVKLVAVTNPLCGYCAESFMVYYKLLTDFKGIQVNFVFTTFSHAVDSHAYRIIATVITLFREEGPDKALAALYEWFQSRDLESWIRKFGVGTKQHDVRPLLDIHTRWAVSNNISYTPTTIIEGYFYPKEYNIEDLLLFIEDMVAEPEQWQF